MRLYRNLMIVGYVVGLPLTIFSVVNAYSHGFGLYGTIPRFWQMAFALGLVALQLALSPWWRARFEGIATMTWPNSRVYFGISQQRIVALKTIKN